VKIKVLYDNEALEGFKAGWGLSILVETGKEKVLFDTGADVPTLRFNAEKLGVKKDEIKCCFISHAHGDHTGGLAWIKSAKVFFPGEYDGSLKEFETLVFDYPIKEQALIYLPKKVMFVGCSHPGIVFMSREAYKKFGKLKLVIGGFHLFDIEEDEIEAIAKEMKKLTEGIAPCHCTGSLGKQIFKRIFGKNFIEVKAGSVLTV